ncbi:hypothetical protein [Fibrella forsythiae]|uniref:Uncharacterized protein n=1 Tax=Fibrella forsythiae TaxID=2817061 RepID=A0ABS3JC12_9BACT|nr:hypothetical protein [Fibrella forsythiae]MBO0947539.1 hypothetical protein [Fibrella forsythiae]
MFSFIVLLTVLIANAVLAAVAFVLPQVVDTIPANARRGLLSLGGIALFNVAVALTFYYLYVHEFSK